MMSALSAPDDLRNVRAAESLILLAKNATELPDEYWERLQPLYDPDSTGWRGTPG
jgi:hypothetical protein